MRLYYSAADHLTHRRYQVRCTEAAATLPAAVALGLVPPIYDVLDPERETLSVKTIVDMTELVSARISFTIVDERDILLIANEIEAYLTQTRTMPRTEELRQFLAKLLPLREQIHRMQKKLFKRRPDWAAKFMGLDSGYIALLYDFMRASGFAVDSSTHPLEAMQQLEARVTGNGALPSLQEELAAAEAKRKIAEQYQENPGSLYDNDVWKL